MNLCICCSKLTYDHCRDCNVSICWPCGASGLCGVCMRMEHYRQEHEMLPTALNVLPVQLILSEEFMPWAASQAKIYSNEETELVEAKG